MPLFVNKLGYSKENIIEFKKKIKVGKSNVFQFEIFFKLLLWKFIVYCVD